MSRRRAKETIKEIDDILHTVTGQRTPYWGKWLWEKLGPKGYQEIAPTEATHDPYAILGIDRNVRPSDIVSRYRELANKYHPDKGGDVEEFKRLQNAYEEICREQNIR